MSNVRHPALAGRFYPSDPDQLRDAVQGYIDAARSPKRDGVPRALIAPHAGYVFSGPIAGSAFAMLDEVRRAIVIGPSHHVRFDGFATSTCDTFATPLGRVQVDVDGVNVARRFDFVRDADAVHQPEHSIETHLPFLQMINPQVRIIPLVTGQCSDHDVASVLEALWDEQTVLCVSSDLSHFEDYDEATEHDARTTRRIVELTGGIGPRDACGSVAIGGLLELARLHTLRAEAVDVRNSGDTAGGRERVVGYGAYGFWSDA